MKTRPFLLLILLCTAIAVVQAQQPAYDSHNFLDFQQKPYYFGITFAYNSGDYKIYQSENFIASDSFQVVQSVHGRGLNVGIVTNLKIGDYFDFRFLPTISFAGRTINYQATANKVPYSRNIQSVFVEMPFHMRYKSQPYKDVRLFLLAGVKYSFDVASESRSHQADDLVKVAPTDFALEVGAGMQFFFPYFILSPELKFSYGLGNILLFDESLEEASVIDKILSRGFTLSFHFEG